MDMQQQMPQGIDPQAEAGRGTDNVMAHMSLGEIVIPRAMQDDPQFMEMLQQSFAQFGADINEFTVGHEANKINPETGYPEFGFGKFFKSKIFKIAAPIALSLLAPGIGSAIGGSILGAGAAGSATLGSALIGGGLGALGGGGLKGALLGAAGGGIGANIGSLADAPLGEGIHGAVRPGEGLLGSLSSSTGLTTNNLPSLSNLVGGSGGGSSFGGLNLNSLSSALGGFQQDDVLKKIRQQQLGAQGQQMQNLENLSPIDVQNDPGYQFNLEQGQQGLNRALGAQGNLFSGAALKAASEYNQNFANNYYKDAYARQANKVGAQNTIYGNQGDINANATLGRSNNINQTLANALGGQVGDYSGSQDELLKRLMLQRGY